MTRLLLSFAALVALMSVDALAGEKKLTGAEIKAAFSGAKTLGSNYLGTFLVVWKADGTMTGNDVNSGAVPDKGKWWVKGDTFCRKWNWWIGGEEECFGVTLDGDKLKWWRANGKMYQPFTLTK